MDTQFITDIKGQKTKAIISIKDYNYFIKLLEEEKMIVNFIMMLKKILMRKPIHLKR